MEDWLNGPTDVAVSKAKFEEVYQRTWEMYVTNECLNDGVTYIYSLQLGVSPKGKMQVHVYLKQLNREVYGEVVVTEE